MYTSDLYTASTPKFQTESLLLLIKLSCLHVLSVAITPNNSTCKPPLPCRNHNCNGQQIIVSHWKTWLITDEHPSAFYNFLAESFVVFCSLIIFTLSACTMLNYSLPWALWEQIIFWLLAHGRLSYTKRFVLYYNYLIISCRNIQCATSG